MQYRPSLHLHVHGQSGVANHGGLLQLPELRVVEGVVVGDQFGKVSCLQLQLQGRRVERGLIPEPPVHLRVQGFIR